MPPKGHHIRGFDIGDFVFHWHILGHEDAGMMNSIRVVPAEARTTSVRKRHSGERRQKDSYAVTVNKLGDTYDGARSNEFGYANYEISATPLIVATRLTAMISQFSIELGLTEQQKQQIVHPEGSALHLAAFRGSRWRYCRRAAPLARSPGDELSSNGRLSRLVGRALHELLFPW